MRIHISATYYYKLIYYTAMDFFLRIFLPVLILLYTNIRVFIVIKEEQFLVILKYLIVNLIYRDNWIIFSPCPSLE